MRFLSPTARHARTTIGHGLVSAPVLLRAFCFYKALGSASDHYEQFVHVEGLRHEWRVERRQELCGDRHPARHPHDEGMAGQGAVTCAEAYPLHPPLTP